MTELLEISSGERERVYLKTGPDPRSLEIPPEPEPEPNVKVTHEEMAEREGIHERIQHENKETRARAEEMLETFQNGMKSQI